MKIRFAGTTHRASLFRLYTRLTELGNRHLHGSPAKHLAGVVALLASIGFPGASHHTAMRFVRAVFGVVDELRKRNWGLAEAKLARSYGAGVFGAQPSPRDLLKLAVNEPAVWAAEKLRDVPNLTPESIRRLTLLATGSEEAADDAWAKAELARMRDGLTPC